VGRISWRELLLGVIVALGGRLRGWLVTETL
jgi:hypothetical protein